MKLETFMNGCLSSMKPTVEQVVDHFELPDEADRWDEIEIAINSVDWERREREYRELRFWSMDRDMDAVAWSFLYEFDCPITDYFKPNHGKD